MAALCLALALPFRALRTAGVQFWTPANLANPPHISIDADRLDLLTKDGSNSLTGVTTEYTALAAGTVTAVVHAAANAGLNNRGSFNVDATNANQVINFSTTAGSLLANKPGCTMVFFGKFSEAAPSALNRAIVNATTTSNNSARCSIASSSTVANCPRHVVRRLDADTANGDDVGVSNRGVLPWIAVLRLDHNGVVVGAGTPTKEMRYTQNGAREVASEATGLGAGNFSNTNSALIGFFNSGAVAPAKVHMNWGCIEDTVYTDAECERLEGYLAWKIGMPEILPSDHPYRNSRPEVT